MRNYNDKKCTSNAWGVFDISHYESGKVCSEQVNYIDGSIGHFVYYEDGKLQSIGFKYSDGSSTYTTYYKDGETKKYEHVTRADGSSTFISYYEDGVTKESEIVTNADGSRTITYYYRSQNKMFEENRDSEDNFISGIFYDDDEKNNERYVNVEYCCADYDSDGKLYYVYVRFIDGSKADIYYTYTDDSVTARFYLYDASGTLIDSYTEINGVRQ